MTSIRFSFFELWALLFCITIAPAIPNDGSKTHSEISKDKDVTPNIVVIMGDDWSAPHASILGDRTVKTPVFDRIAREGILFENAYTPAPSCTPSRHAFSTGQYHWRLGEGVNLGGSLPADIPVYPDLLSDAGYRTGFCRKGIAPGQHKYRGNDPLGKRYKNFSEFYHQRENSEPFCFWYGAGEPHRPYDWQASRKSHIDLSTIEIPPFLPDNDITRTDLGDYYMRVEKLDQFAGEIVSLLEKAGDLENTIIVMTSDNGMPFPRAKATLYDSGTRVPLAIRWGAKVKAGLRISDFVSLTDLAPNFLEACGLPVPNQMTGRSLMKTLLTGDPNPLRKYIVTGMERHVHPYPSRAIRNEHFLYIRNFAPADWPTGKANGPEPVFDFTETPWPTVPGAFSHNTDPGPSKQWMRSNDSPQNLQAFGRKPAEELYDLGNDPWQLDNLLAGKKVTEQTRKKRRDLSDLLTAELRSSGDPRFRMPAHTTFQINGWNIHLSDELWSINSERTAVMLELLDTQLQRVLDAVPGKALAQLRQIPIWINPPYPGDRGKAEFHPSHKWLKDNGRNPAMARAVEITNVDIFLFENRRMPYLLLHELAHGYHFRNLPQGYKNPEIEAAFALAKKSGVYEEVDRFDGKRIRKDKAYAITNPMEYFAESTEAYFGKNDFFPFNRQELKQHDPSMMKLLEKLWGVEVSQ